MRTSLNFIHTSISSAELTLLMSDLGLDIESTSSYINPNSTEWDATTYASIMFERIVTFLQNRYDVSVNEQEARDYDNGGADSSTVAVCTNERGHRIAVILTIDFNTELVVDIEGTKVIVCTSDEGCIND